MTFGVAHVRGALGGTATPVSFLPLVVTVSSGDPRHATIRSEARIAPVLMGILGYASGSQRSRGLA